MADDSRPSDWDWVKATHQCSAQVMFGELKALARRDVQTRNQQLERDAFQFRDTGSLSFSIAEGNNASATVSFMVTDDLARISVASARDKTIYTVGLDANGVCKFKRNGETLDAWQVLKAILGPVFFDA